MHPVTDKIILLLLLGGSGNRFNSRIPKQFMRLGRHTAPLFIETIRNLRKEIIINDIVLVGNPEFMTREEFLAPLELFRETNGGNMKIHTTAGGSTRHQSFLKGAGMILENYNNGIVLVHDANRPNIEPSFGREIARAVNEASAGKPCLIPVVPSTDSLCRVTEGKIEKYIPRDEIFKIQTPQIVRLDSMKQAVLSLNRAQDADFTASFTPDFTDEGSFMIASGFQVFTYPGSPANIKITYPEDI